MRSTREDRIFEIFILNLKMSNLGKNDFYEFLTRIKHIQI